MSTNEQDRTDGAAVSTINRDEGTAVLVGGEQIAEWRFIPNGLHSFAVLSVGDPIGRVRPLNVHLHDADEIRAIIRGGQHALELLERAHGVAAGGDVIKALRGTPDGESLAVAADMDREGRAA